MNYDIYAAFNRVIAGAYRFGTGVGQVTGWNYVVNDSSHQEVNTRGVAQEQSFGTKMKMISQGSAPNLNERTTLHVVIDSNNNVKVEKLTDNISRK